MTVPPVLLEPDFLPLWRRISSTLDRRGLDDRGWVPLPDTLAPGVRARLPFAVPTTRRWCSMPRKERRISGRAGARR